MQSLAAARAKNRVAIGGERSAEAAHVGLYVIPRLCSNICNQSAGGQAARVARLASTSQARRILFSKLSLMP